LGGIDLLYITLNEFFEYDWFKVKNIRIPPQYSVKEAIDSLSTIFSFSGLKTFGGADLSALYEHGFSHA
jgi:hypothetical protein